MSTATRSCRHGTSSLFLLQNVVLWFKPTGLTMTGVSRKVLLLSVLLLCVNPCVPERAERDNDGGDVKPNENVAPENQQRLTKHGKEDGLDSSEDKKQNDGQSVRFEPIYILE